MPQKKTYRGKIRYFPEPKKYNNINNQKLSCPPGNNNKIEKRNKITPRGLRQPFLQFPRKTILQFWHQILLKTPF